MSQWRTVEGDSGLLLTARSIVARMGLDSSPVLRAMRWRPYCNDLHGRVNARDVAPMTLMLQAFGSVAVGDARGCVSSSGGCGRAPRGSWRSRGAPGSAPAWPA